MPDGSFFRKRDSSGSGESQYGTERDPYRLFFPLGVLAGVAGVAIWPLYYFGLTSTYSGRSHALVQTVGFLYSFVAGFLLTAIPRLTGTATPRLSAQFALAAAIVASVIASELRLFVVATGAFVLAHAMLLALISMDHRDSLLGCRHRGWRRAPAVKIFTASTGRMKRPLVWNPLAASEIAPMSPAPSALWNRAMPIAAPTNPPMKNPATAPMAAKTRGSFKSQCESECPGTQVGAIDSIEHRYYRRVPGSDHDVMGPNNVLLGSLRCERPRDFNADYNAAGTRFAEITMARTRAIARMCWERLLSSSGLICRRSAGQLTPAR